MCNICYLFECLFEHFSNAHYTVFREKINSCIMSSLTVHLWRRD